MADATRSVADPETGELIISRIFDAPPELVFRMWADPEHVAQWWGPKHFTNPVCEVDARPGGRLLIHMQSPDGQVYPAKGTFEEVDGKTKLTMHAAVIRATDAAVDALAGMKQGWTESLDKLAGYLPGAQQTVR
ncbi:hypothetical protein BH23CHL2_BH23CHL2_31090 [soil metagenome]